MAPLPEIVSRFREIGIWDEAEKCPVFGWFPVMLGWRIQVNSRSKRVWLNGILWNGEKFTIAR